MKGAHSISTRRAYGVQRVCRVWHRARSSVYARRQATTSPCRRGPVGAAPDDVLVGHIGRMLEASPFHGEGYRKAWAKLRVEGRDRTRSWISGARRSRPMTWVTRAREIPSRRAMAAWLEASPDSRRAGASAINCCYPALISF